MGLFLGLLRDGILGIMQCCLGRGLRSVVLLVTALPQSEYFQILKVLLLYVRASLPWSMVSLQQVSHH